VSPFDNAASSDASPAADTISTLAASLSVAVFSPFVVSVER
jgi:hypothetical protein